MTNPSPTPAEPQPLTERLRRTAVALYTELPLAVAHDVSLLLGEAAATLSSLLADTQRLEKAIRWALGEDGEFRVRDSGTVFLEGPYYWRPELRLRAFGARAIDAARTTPAAADHERKE